MLWNLKGPREAMSTSDDWSCPTCTCWNPAKRMCCEVCDTPNPTPRQYLPEGLSIFANESSFCFVGSDPDLDAAVLASLGGANKDASASTSSPDSFGSDDVEAQVSFASHLFERTECGPDSETKGSDQWWGEEAGISWQTGIAWLSGWRIQNKWTIPQENRSMFQSTVFECSWFVAVAVFVANLTSWLMHECWFSAINSVHLVRCTRTLFISVTLHSGCQEEIWQAKESQRGWKLLLSLSMTVHLFCSSVCWSCAVLVLALHVCSFVAVCALLQYLFSAMEQCLTNSALLDSLISTVEKRWTPFYFHD